MLDARLPKSAFESMILHCSTLGGEPAFEQPVVRNRDPLMGGVPQIATKQANEDHAMPIAANAATAPSCDPNTAINRFL